MCVTLSPDSNLIGGFRSTYRDNDEFGQVVLRFKDPSTCIQCYRLISYWNMENITEKGDAFKLHTTFIEPVGNTSKITNITKMFYPQSLGLQKKHWDGCGKVHSDEKKSIFSETSYHTINFFFCFFWNKKQINYSSKTDDYTKTKK